MEWTLFLILGAATACVLIGFGVALLRRLAAFERKMLDCLTLLSVPLALASTRGYGSLFRRFAGALAKVDQQEDTLFHDLASLALTNLVKEAEGMAHGTLVFTGTETWRAAYQSLLTTLSVGSYLSVAWVRSSDYWNDAPGRRSMEMNFNLVKEGFYIERMHILPDELWPWEQKLPAPEIRPWLAGQHERGIIVRLVREADLAGEPDLLRDFAVYGDRATAVQELDERARTLRYSLSFDLQTIRQALDRWERLGLYAISWQRALEEDGPRRVA